jgi:hypothetical protein
LVYPNYLPVLADPTVLSSFFAPAVKGRIAPLGQGDDLYGVMKVFFGLSPVTDPNSAVVTVTSVNFRTLTEQDPNVAVEVDVTFTPTATGLLFGLTPYQIRETGRFTFDSQNKITTFDLSIPYLDTALFYVSPSDASTKQQMIQCICATYASYCNVANDPQGFYSSLTDCVNFLGTLPPGSWNRVSGNNVVCRFVDTPFVQFNPSLDCPVLGHTGGGQCVDTGYSTYFSDSF